MFLPSGNGLKCQCEQTVEKVKNKFDQIRLLDIVKKGKITTEEDLKALQMGLCLTIPPTIDLYCQKGINEWGNSYFFLNNRDKFLVSDFSKNLPKSTIREFLDSLLRTFWDCVPDENKDNWKPFFEECELALPGPVSDQDTELTEKFLQFIVSQDLETESD